MKNRKYLFVRCWQRSKIPLDPIQLPSCLLFWVCLLFSLLSASCGMVTPTHQLRPTSKPSLFFLSNGELEAYQMDGGERWHLPASSTGFISMSSGTHLLHAGSTLYTATDSIQATTFSGKMLWQHQLADQANDLLKVGSILFVLCRGPFETLTAWDSISGTLLWQQSAMSLPLGPWAHLTSNRNLLFLGGLNQIVALKMYTGEIVWHQDIDPGDGIAREYVDNHILLLQTGTKIMAVQITTGTMLWQRDSQIQSLSIIGTILYTISIDVPDPTEHPLNAPTWSGLRAVDLMTGRQLWSVAQPILITGVSSISSNEILADEGNFITAWNLQGCFLWQVASVGTPVLSVELVSQAQIDLIFEQDGMVQALNSQDGRQRWEQSFSFAQNYQMIVQNDQCWIMSKEDGYIIARSLLHGTTTWSLKRAPFDEMLLYL